MTLQQMEEITGLNNPSIGRLFTQSDLTFGTDYELIECKTKPLVDVHQTGINKMFADMPKELLKITLYYTKVFETSENI